MLSFLINLEGGREGGRRAGRRKGGGKGDKEGKKEKGDKLVGGLKVTSSRVTIISGTA